LAAIERRALAMREERLAVSGAEMEREAGGAHSQGRCACGRSGVRPLSGHHGWMCAECDAVESSRAQRQVWP
jgi:hypothetical protein